jgi:uncharacterized protein
VKILAISDTHIEGENIPQFLKDVIVDYDLVIHAGDFTSYECFKAFEATGKLKAVYGNADDPRVKQILPEQNNLEIEGIRVGIIHEGALSVNDTTAIGYKALEMNVDILVFGHLHRPLIEQGDVLLICPGSPTKPRMSDPCAVEIEIKDGKASSKIIEIVGQACDYVEYARKLAENK